jgi:hypothetical protein
MSTWYEERQRHVDTCSVLSTHVASYKERQRPIDTCSVLSPHIYVEYLCRYVYISTLDVLIYAYDWSYAYEWTCARSKIEWPCTFEERVALHIQDPVVLHIQDPVVLHIQDSVVLHIQDPVVLHKSISVVLQKSIAMVLCKIHKRFSARHTLTSLQDTQTLHP